MATHKTSPMQGPRTGRTLNIGLWILQVLLALFFAIASASPKLVGHESARVTFDTIGYGDWFMYFIGVLELAGAVALVIPFLSGVAAIALASLMVGAFIYEVTVIQAGFWYTPVILLLLFLFIAWGRWDRTSTLLRTFGMGFGGRDR